MNKIWKTEGCRIWYQQNTIWNQKDKCLEKKRQFSFRLNKFKEIDRITGVQIVD